MNPQAAVCWDRPWARAQVTGILQRPHAPPLAFPSAADVKFISNPPSMVAAGSVVAAVQGLHLGSSNSFLSYHRLTRFLSTLIKCDLVSDRAPLPLGQGQTCWSRGGDAQRWVLQPQLAPGGCSD